MPETRDNRDVHRYADGREAKPLDLVVGSYPIVRETKLFVGSVCGFIHPEHTFVPTIKVHAFLADSAINPVTLEIPTREAALVYRGATATEPAIVGTGIVFDPNMPPADVQKALDESAEVNERDMAILRAYDEKCRGRPLAGYLAGYSLTFNHLREANFVRCQESFHGIDRWTPTDWACAMAGECGEACNEIKKLRRLQTNPDWNDPDSSDSQVITGRIAHELADLVIYADLLAARLGIDLGTAVVEKFNQVSEKVGSTRRLGR